MIELPKGRSPQLMLDNNPKPTALEVLEFRKMCLNTKKMGMMSVGLGSVIWVDRDGSYMDGKVHPAEEELVTLLSKLADFEHEGIRVGGA